MVCADWAWLAFCVWAAYGLRLSELWPSSYLYDARWLFFVLPTAGVAVLWSLGLYRSVARFMGAKATLAVVKGALIIAVISYPLSFLFNDGVTPRSFPIIFGLVAFMGIAGMRFAIRTAYYWLLGRQIEKAPVLIYGAGGAGVQLASAVDLGGEYYPIGFVDDDRALHGRTVMGLNVYPPSQIGELIERTGTRLMLLALPSEEPNTRRRIIERLASYPIQVKTMPSLTEIIAGEALTQLRNVEVEDLLGRDPVPSVPDLISRSLKNRTVMVTGAGGSIGSELCRQAVSGGAKCIVLFEQSEYALYQIEQELSLMCHRLGNDTCIIPILGSVVDRFRISQVFKRYKVHVVYHAAAYKHVPLVEHNVLQGVKNNTLGTLAVAEASLHAGVERFILISTDKAVRPTNVMGATKRLAELVVQDLAKRSKGTCFSMVRFGNVLGSSGSVVPLFKRQISEGGPVTVTHPEITRYFMTIPEAASLVIQAGSMAQGGDVFVLDMGEPVRIADLAKRMIHLMGKTVQGEKDNELSGVEICFTGLRPGEKLYEELLVGEDVAPTEHPKILRANESSLEPEKIQSLLADFERIIDTNQAGAARDLLEMSVVGFHPKDSNLDLLSETPYAV